jgi:hypothetical protein
MAYKAGDLVKAGSGLRAVCAGRIVDVPAGTIGEVVIAESSALQPGLPFIMWRCGPVPVSVLDTVIDRIQVMEGTQDE